MSLFRTVLPLWYSPLQHNGRVAGLTRTAEIPSNWILSRVKRPSWYLGGLVVSWGLVMTFSGFVQSYEGLLAARFMLGVTEWVFNCFSHALCHTNQLDAEPASIQEHCT